MMMKMFLQILALLFACLVMTTAAPSYDLRRSRNSVAEETTEICQRNHLCRWAVCNWSQWFRISPEHCQFIESSCRCPSNMQCERSSMRPGSQVIVFNYHCN